jgi:hypothetical protein
MYTDNLTKKIFLREHLITFNIQILLLSCFVDHLCERLLPAVHLDHLDPVDDLIHEPDPLVCPTRCLDSQLTKLLTNEC